MADKTKIEWTDATWNIITGCSIASPGCTNCYAMKLAGSGRAISQHPSRVGLTKPSKAGPVWTGEVRFNEAWLEQPLRWKRPRKIFVCAHGDLFHEDVPTQWILAVFAVMIVADQHVYQILTKRAARMRAFMEWVYHTEDGSNALVEAVEALDEKANLDFTMLPPNLWLGVSVEDQARADERIPDLLKTPAAVRWLSCEPLLGHIDLTRICIVPRVQRSPRAGIHIDALRGRYVESGMPFIGEWDIDGPYPEGAPPLSLNWVIVGGESGPGARPMHPDWACSLRDQCTEADVAFNFKQWGSWKAIYDRDREDPDWRQCSTILNQNPKGRWLNLAGGHGFHGERVHFVIPAGKSATGRILDGIEHNAFPGEVA